MNARIVPVALLIVAMVVLSACQAGTSPSAAQDSAESIAATPAAAQDSAESIAATPAAARDSAESTAATPAAQAAADRLVVYSGRSENLVGPLLEQFSQATGVAVDIRYGDTAEMAATILEEGANSPADVFFGQDAGALGALAQAGRLAPLPAPVLEQVAPRFRSPTGEWVGTSGRARVLVYNTDTLSAADLPASVLDLADPQWQGRVGWAPTNGSFQSFVTALRLLVGENETRSWLEAMVANDVQVYPNNTAIVQAVAAGEIDVGLVNHYYLFRFLAEEGDDFPARNYYFPAGDPGAMINVAGAGILDSAQHPQAAQQFVEFLLSAEAQQFFADETAEYPLAAEGIELSPLLEPLDDVQAPDLNLGDLSDLQGTLELLQEAGALE